MERKRGETRFPAGVSVDLTVHYNQGMSTQASHRASSVQPLGPLNLASLAAIFYPPAHTPMWAYVKGVGGTRNWKKEKKKTEEKERNRLLH